MQQVVESFQLVDNIQDFEESIAVIQEYLRNVQKPKLALDLETYSLDGVFPNPYKKPDGSYEGYIRTLAIGLDPSIFDRQFIFDFSKIDGNMVIDALGPWLEDPAITIVGQNLKYDWKFLYVQYGIYMQRMRDLMLLSQCINAGDKIKHNLSSLYREYFEWGWFKDLTGRTFAEYDEYKKELQLSDWTSELDFDQLKYAADDVKLVFYLYKAQLDKLDRMVLAGECKQNLASILQLECDLIPAYAMMEVRGIGFDAEHHKNVVIPYLEDKLQESEKEVAKYFTYTKTISKGRGKSKVTYDEEVVINMRSWQQLRGALEPIVGKLPDTSEKTLKTLVHKHPSIRWILQNKKASSLLSKFGQKYLDLLHADGRLHPSWFQIGSDENAVDTGRSSCKDPNMQQVPSRETFFGEITAVDLFRKLVKPIKTGRKIISIDMSQIEPRGAAQVTNDPALINAFNNADEADLHALTAQALMGLPYLPDKNHPEWDTNDKIRFYRNYVGKTANLALGYGIGAKKLAKFMYDNTPDDNKVDWRANECEEAKEKVEAYFTMFSGIRDKMQEIDRKVRKQFEGVSSLSQFRGRKLIFSITNLAGRKRGFYLTAEQEKMAKEDPEKLHKSYKAFNEAGEPCQNEYNKRMSQISREAYNFLIQGLCADILKYAVLNAHNTLRALGVPDDEGIIAVVHDEIVLEVSEERADEVIEVVRNCMIEAGKMFIKKVPIRVHGTIGNSWGDAH